MPKRSCATPGRINSGQPDKAAVIPANAPRGVFLRTLLLTCGCSLSILFPSLGQFAYYEFSAQSFRAPENAGSALISVRRWGNLSLDFTIDWYARSGFAIAGVDFVGVTNTLHFAPGETNKTALVPLIDDGALEELESVSLTFANLSSSSGATTGLVNHAVLVIEDNEIPSLLDGAYQPHGEPDDDVFSLLLQPDGRLLVGGEFSGLGDPDGTDFVLRRGVARLHPDGSIDQTFATSDGVSEGVYALARQLDGKILVGGGFETNQNNSRRFLSRLNANGTLDAAFVATVNDEIRGIVVQPDQKIVIAGRFTQVNAQSRGRIARLNPDGSLDNTFNAGAGANNNIRVLFLQSDGRLLIGGQFTTYDTTTRGRVARLLADGTLDTTFNPLAGANGQVRAIAVASDGSVYLGGDFGSYDGLTRPGLARALPTGGADPAFNAGLGGTDTVRGLLLQADGRLLAGGNFRSANGLSRTRVARFLTNGTPDITFLSAEGPDNEVFSIVQLPEGQIWIGGQFTQVAGVPRARLARLLPDSRVPSVEYAKPWFVAAETWPQVVIPIRRTGESSNVVSATWFTAAGTALPGSDYITFSNALQFSSLQVTQSFAVALVNDHVAEPLESVRLLVTNITGANPGVWREAELAIDSTGAGAITVFPPTLSEQGVAEGCLVVRAITNLPLTLYYTTQDNTAIAGLDYQPAAGVFELAAGVPSGYIYLQPLNDSLPESTERFFLELRETPGSPVLASTSVSILDNELGIGIYNTETSVNEDAGTVSFYVICQWDPTSPVEVDYATRETGSARAGLDFTETFGTLVFTKYAEAQTITIPIRNDGLVEKPESFEVILTGRRGPASLTRTNGVVVIFDNDQGLGFATNLVSVGESESQVSLSVFRRDDGPNTVTVDYATADGSASAGLDYTATSGTLTLPPGSGVKTFTVPLRGDALLETDETFRVFLRNPTGGASLAGSTSLVVRLVDDERPGSLDPQFVAELEGRLFSAGPGGKLALEPAGDIILATGGTLMRLGPQGQFDPNFAVGQAFFQGFVPLVQADGRIIVGATSSNSLGENRSVFRVLHDGSLDPTFDADIPFGRTTALALQTDGLLLIGGNYDTWWPDEPNNGLRRLTATGRPDPSFSAGVFLPRGASFESPSTVEALLLQADGRILVGGKFHQVAERACDRIIRLNANGSVDPTFFCDGVAGLTNNAAAVWALAWQSDGKILVAGDFVALQGSAQNGVLRLNANGTVDPTFHSPLAAGTIVRAVKVQTDGKIIVGGGDGWWPWAPSPAFVLRLNPDGSVDETFDPGLPPDGTVTDLAVLPDGDILVAGAFNSFNGLPRLAVVRLNGGTIPYARLALKPDAAVAPEGGAMRVEVTRGGDINQTTTVELLTRAGTALPDEDFEPQHLLLTFAPGERSRNVDVLVHSDWLTESDESFQVLLANPSGGNTLLLSSETTVTILDQNRPGSLDPSFTGSTDQNSSVDALAVQKDGKILVAGSFSRIDGALGSYARLNADGTLDPTFQLSPMDNYRYVRCLALQPDGRILIGGDIKTIHGQPRVGIARLLENGALDNSFVSAFDDLGASSQTVGLIVPQPDGRLLVSGSFAKIAGQDRRTMARLLPNGALDPSFNPDRQGECSLCGGFGDGVGAIVPLPNGQILIGGSFVTDGIRRFLGRLNSDGTPDHTFGAGSGPNASVRAIALLPDGRILIAGIFDLVDGQPRAGLARLEADGRLVPEPPLFSGVDNDVTCLTTQPDGNVLIGGYFHTVNGVTRPWVARLHPTLTLDPSFDPSVLMQISGGGVAALGLQPDGHIVIGGNFSLAPFAEQYNLARLRGQFLPYLQAVPAVPPTTGVGLSLFTQPGAVYVMEASADLLHWSPVLTNLATTSRLNLRAPGADNFPERFYRARQVLAP